MSKHDDIYLTTEDLWGRTTVMTTQTYSVHTAGRPSEDGDTRARAAPMIVNVLKSPRYVYNDTKGHGKVKYADLIFDDKVEPRPGMLVVCVDTRLDPQEIVTWVWVTRVSKEDFSGGIIYDSAKDTDSSR